MQATVACLMDKRDNPFIIARKQKYSGVIFCTKDEFVGETDYNSSEKFYYFMGDDDENHFRGLVVGKQCLISNNALQLFKDEYGIDLQLSGRGYLKYSQIKPYLKYLKVEIDVNFI